MGNAANEFVHLAIRFKPHPLNAVGAAVKAGNMQLQMRDISLARMRH